MRAALREREIFVAYKAYTKSLWMILHILKFILVKINEQKRNVPLRNRRRIELAILFGSFILHLIMANCVLETAANCVASDGIFAVGTQTCKWNGCNINQAHT